MFTYLMFKRLIEMYKPDIDDYIFTFMLSLLTIMLDFTLLLLQPLFIILYKIVKKKNKKRWE